MEIFIESILDSQHNLQHKTSYLTSTGQQSRNGSKNHIDFQKHQDDLINQNHSKTQIISNQQIKQQCSLNQKEQLRKSKRIQKLKSQAIKRKIKKKKDKQNSVIRKQQSKNHKLKQYQNKQQNNSQQIIQTVNEIPLQVIDFFNHTIYEYIPKQINQNDDQEIETCEKQNCFKQYNWPIFTFNDNQIDQLLNLDNHHDQINKSQHSLLLSDNSNNLKVECQDQFEKPQHNNNQSLKQQIQNLIQMINDENQIDIKKLLDEKNNMLLFKQHTSGRMEEYKKSAQKYCESLGEIDSHYNYIDRNKNYVKFVVSSLGNYGKEKCQKINLGGYFLDVSHSGNEHSINNIIQVNNLQQNYINEQLQFRSLWRQIHQSFKQNDTSKEIIKYMLILTKCYKKNKVRINQLLAEVKLKVNSSDEQNNSLCDSNDFYMKCLIKKCMTSTFDEKFTLKSEYEIWNYYKYETYKQNVLVNQEGFRDQQAYLPIYTVNSYKDYMKKIYSKSISKSQTDLSKLNKSNKFRLFSPNCSACFSNHHEKCNPLIKCCECKIKIHKQCLMKQGRCGKCDYKRVNGIDRQRTPRCFICKNQSESLMLFRVKSGLNCLSEDVYVHNFCMLMHNMWDVHKGNLIFRRDVLKSVNLNVNYEQNKQQLNLSPFLLKKTKEQSVMINELSQKDSFLMQMIDENSLQFQINQKQQSRVEMSKSSTYPENIPKYQYPQINSLNSNKCKFCNKFAQNNITYLIKCMNCHEKVHILCACLNGCRIEIKQWKQNFKIDFDIFCCDEQNQEQFIKEKEIRKFSNQYKLNYNNFVIKYVETLKSQSKTT